VSLTAVAFVVASALYTGFHWTIRVLAYPQFAQVPADAFVPYERNHQRLVSIAVGPLFAALVVTALAVLVDRPDGTPLWEPILGVGLVGVILAVTALVAVPLHGRLGTGFDLRTHRRLLAVDAVRLGAAALTTAVAVAVLAG
jgi:hypothetical protein